PMIYIKKYIIPVILLTIIPLSNLYSKSSATKSRNDYEFTLNVLRKVSPMVRNFGSDEIKNDYKKVKDSFQIASESLYGTDYDSAFDKFRTVKDELIKMLGKISNVYLVRTKNIMDSTSKESFDILIKYTKDSGFGKYLKKSYDPLNDVKPYKETEYHLFHSRQTIEAYLQNGYKFYHMARKIYNDPEIELLKQRKSLPSKSLNYIINQYLQVVYSCRQSKTYGIEIHKILNRYKLEESLRKYGVKKTTLNPIFDDRIPDKYKIDAIDNKMLIYAVELRRLGKNRENNTQ
ncbi:hypothetical protein KY321_03555, partial [Candidatus Woesearchaeota archaeon]|nr:hypothetical protein [Candidatus Woesearchaeota archaeon]